MLSFHYLKELYLHLQSELVLSLQYILSLLYFFLVLMISNPLHKLDLLLRSHLHVFLKSKPFCSNSVRSIRIVVPLTPNFLINSVLLTRLLTLSISKIFSCLSSANMYDNLPPSSDFNLFIQILTYSI